MPAEYHHRVTSDMGPFAIVPAWIIDSELSDGAIRLYAVLATYANYDTGRCWPSLRTLAERCDCSKDTILRRRTELVNAGAIRIGRRTSQTTMVTVITRRPRHG